MRAPSWPAWLLAGAGLVLLGLGFHQEVSAAIAVWNASTAYGHCWLVLPITAWLLWERRAAFAANVPHPAAWPALAAVPVVLLWLAAYWLGVMEGRQLALIALAELLIIACVGARTWWSLSAAFLYLVFLVPFGAFLTPALQHFTTWFILAGLRLLDVPFQADAFQITIPEGVFYVAEACAGLRFLIASVAFGVLYAVTIFASPWRRAAFIAVSCVVPVLANGVRGLGIVLLGHVLGSAEAGVADHIIYGWVFFSFVIILLALAGLPFRQDAGSAPAGRPAGRTSQPGRVALAAAAVLLVAYAGPFVLGGLGARASTGLAAIVPSIVVPPRCEARGAVQEGAVSTQTVQCGAARLRVIATTLPSGANPTAILEAGRKAALDGLGTDIDSEAWRTPSGAPWVMLTAHETNRQAAYAVWVDGRQVLGGLRERLVMARDMFGHASTPPLAIAVTLESPDLDGVEQLRAFLTAQTEL